MIDIRTLREQYCKIIFWGAIEESLVKYNDYVKVDDYIVDADNKKRGIRVGNLTVYEPERIMEENKKAAVVILALNYEKDIYNRIRKFGFAGDVYSDDMIALDYEVSDKYIVKNGKYTIEKHTQILISLLKEYGIKNVIVSPGTCNMNFVYSIQNDPYFKLWSCIDERSAGYMACGIAQTMGEPVALSCTGATASRNYMSALTEAYYSKLPIVAITSSRDSYMIGNGIEQITDRGGQLPRDIVRTSVEISPIHNLTEKKYCELNINRALSMLRMHGGGPVHINLITRFEKDFSTKTLPQCRVIKTITMDDEFPDLKGKIALYIRPSMELRDERLTTMIDSFCEKYDAIVVGDHLSNYKGKYFIDISLIAEQSIDVYFDTLIYVGGLNREINIKCKTSWRVSADGNIEDPYLNLRYYFDMSLKNFIYYYNGKKIQKSETTLFDELTKKYKQIIQQLPELPFSNLWVAKQLSSQIPPDSLCFFGIYSTLRNWSYFKMDNTIQCYSTVGGYGIDGTLSSMMGASFVNPSKLCFCFLGDLSFFYDMNVLGNINIKNNIRIIVFNNNGGNSLLHRNGLPSENESGKYVAAVGHYNKEHQHGNEIRAFAESLGFKYMCAYDKEQFLEKKEEFLSKSERPIIYEIGYAAENDFLAVDIIKNVR